MNGHHFILTNFNIDFKDQYTMPHTSIEHVFDNNLNKAKEILKVPASSYDEILKDKKIEVVCVCTPNKFHKEIIIDSIFAADLQNLMK